MTMKLLFALLLVAGLLRATAQDIGRFSISRAAAGAFTNASLPEMARAMRVGQYVASLPDLATQSGSTSPSNIMVLDALRGGSFVERPGGMYATNFNVISNASGSTWVRHEWIQLGTLASKAQWAGAVADDAIADDDSVELARAVNRRVIFNAGAYILTNYWRPYGSLNNGAYEIGAVDETWEGSPDGSTIIDANETVGGTGNLRGCLFKVMGGPGKFTLRNISLRNYQNAFYDFQNGRHITNHVSVLIDGGHHKGNVFWAAANAPDGPMGAAGNFYRTNVIINGAFDSADDWTLGAGWSLSAGAMLHAGGGGTNALTATIPNLILRAGDPVRVAYDITGMTAGNVKIVLNGRESKTNALSTTGATELTITPAVSGPATFSVVPTDTFDGSIDNVQVYVANWLDFEARNATFEQPLAFNTAGFTFRIVSAGRRLSFQNCIFQEGSAALFIGNPDSLTVRTNSHYLMPTLDVLDCTFRNLGEHPSFDARAVYFFGGPPHILNCTFKDISIPDPESEAFANTLYLNTQGALIENCRFIRSGTTIHKGTSITNINDLGDIASFGIEYRDCFWDRRGYSKDSRLISTDAMPGVVRVLGGSVMGMKVLGSMFETGGGGNAGFSIRGMQFFDTDVPSGVIRSTGTGYNEMQEIADCIFWRHKSGTSSLNPFVSLSTTGSKVVRIVNNRFFGMTDPMGTLLSLGSGLDFPLIEVTGNYGDSQAIASLIRASTVGMTTIGMLIEENNYFPTITTRIANPDHMSISRGLWSLRLPPFYGVTTTTPTNGLVAGGWFLSNNVVVMRNGANSDWFLP